MVALNYKQDHVIVNKYSRPGDPLIRVQAIVIHYTANPGANALMHANFFDGADGGGGRYAGAHIFVDRKEALEVIPLDEVGYHANERKAGPLLSALKASTSYYPGGNANLLTIGIEMCVEKDGSFHPDTVERTRQVVKMLQAKFPQLADTQNRVVRHYDITGKICPKPYVDNPSAWKAFLKSIDEPAKQSPVKPNPKYTTDPTDRIGEVVIGDEPMNYRKEPNVDAPILRELAAGHGSKSTVHLYEEKDGWLRLGIGWISNVDGAYAKVKKYNKPPHYDMGEGLRKGLAVINRDTYYHAEPTEHSRVLSVLKKDHGKNSTVHIYDEKGDWVRLGQGWVRRQDLTVKPLPKQTIYRVIIDGKQVGAYGEDDNALEEARKAIASGSSNIRIEKV